MDSKKPIYVATGLIVFIAAGGIIAYSLVSHPSGQSVSLNGNFGEAGASDLGLEGTFIKDIPLEDPQETIHLSEEDPVEIEQNEQTEDSSENEGGEIGQDEKNRPSSDIVFLGSVISGNKTKFIEFNVEDFEKATEAHKIIVLYFYANWCPICRAEVLIVGEAFEEIDSEKVIGFRVNFQDDDTDDAEKELAKKYNVVNQHTKVIIKPDGAAQVGGAPWVDKEEYITAIEAALSKL